MTSHPQIGDPSRSRAALPPKSDLKNTRILVFNFFAGILARGIPIYTDNLCEALHRTGCKYVQLRCPKLLRKLPRPLLNVAFVLCEQILVPVLAAGFDLVICPYNSVPLASCSFRRIVPVIHDFIPNARKDYSLAASYIKVSQRAHALFRRRVIYASRTTKRIGEKAKLFPHSQSFLFPNAFFQFESMVSLSAGVSPGHHVLLCSGWGENKDLGGAINLYIRSELYKAYPLRILGLSNRHDFVQDLRLKNKDVADRITLLPRLTAQEVIEEYQAAAWIWVHSNKEGYGRSIAEAKLCGRKIIASDIAPFREQADKLTWFYSDLRTFSTAIHASESYPRDTEKRSPKEHSLLFSEIERLLQAGMDYRNVPQVSSRPAKNQRENNET